MCLDLVGGSGRNKIVPAGRVVGRRATEGLTDWHPWRISSLPSLGGFRRLCIFCHRRVFLPSPYGEAQRLAWLSSTIIFFSFAPWQLERACPVATIFAGDTSLQARHSMKIRFVILERVPLSFYLSS